MRQKLSALNTDTARARLIIHYCRANKLDDDSSLSYALRALKIAEENGGELLVSAYGAVGDAYWFTRNYPRASEYYFRQLEGAERLGLKQMRARAYYNIGWMKCMQQESFKDRNYLINALRIFENIGDTASILEVYNALAGIYYSQSDLDDKYSDSANYYFRNLVFFSEKSGKRYNVIVHANYAAFLINKGKYNEAKKYLLRCREEARKYNETANYASCMKSLGTIYWKTDSVEKAKEIFAEIIPLLKETAQIETLADSYLTLTAIYNKEKNFEKAFENHVLYTEMKDSVRSGIFAAHVNEKESQYEIEKRESNIRKLEQQNEISELRNKQNTYVIFGLLFIALLVAIITVNLFRINRAKQRTNKLLNEKNRVIEEQKKAVEEKNTDITNSINYAKRIQDAILPHKEIKYRLFPDAFVLFQPKDIVSGDFYWFAEKNGRKLIAAIDCTGHGVPGAFMSMIGNTLLNEAVNEKAITQPATILNELRDNIITSLKQTDVIDSTKDGMDMAMLSFSDSDNFVEFAGANNPLWLIRDNKCFEYKGDKRPIGFYGGQGLPFTNVRIDLKKGDALYIFSDGYADQFGGEKGKKLKYSRLREHLLSIQHLSMPDQEKFLISAFNRWKGELEQVDDVCVIGIRV